MTCRHLCRIPPAPEVMAQLHAEYVATKLTGKITFPEYLLIIGYADPSVNRDGMDDGQVPRTAPGGAKLFTIPAVQVQGKLRVIVLLADFADRPGVRPKDDYEALLFSRGQLPSGSMADYYDEVSCGKVQVEGSVHGWLRLPRPYSAYVNNESGMGRNQFDTSYPNNAQAMAEDAVRAALDAGVPFPADLDALGNGQITALFIVHAGPGAEVQTNKNIAKRHIWSHKWSLANSVRIVSGLEASVYLTVPEDCRVGVCAHELGHLAFQWDDFYDANYDEDGQYWDGTGIWDLMAGGSYNGSGRRPAHPAGLHKMQHGWIDVVEIGPANSPQAVEIAPYAKSGGTIVRVRSDVFDTRQYLLLENRDLGGFDDGLPGPGLLVWRVDERLINTTPRAGLFLVQADGKNQLLNPDDLNNGDDGDPFPGKLGVSSIGDDGTTSTSFPGMGKSGIRLANIQRLANGNVRLSVEVK